MQDALTRIAELAPKLSHTEVRVLLELARQATTTGKRSITISGRDLAATANLSYSNMKAAMASLNSRNLISSDKGTATAGATHTLTFLDTVHPERGAKFEPPPVLNSNHCDAKFEPPRAENRTTPGAKFEPPPSPPIMRVRAPTIENSDSPISTEDRSTWRLLNAKPTDYDAGSMAAARSWMESYKAKFGDGKGDRSPDDKICAEFLAVAEITRLENLIYELHAERKKPGDSFAWFVTVAVQRIWRMAPDEYRERRRRLADQRRKPPVPQQIHKPLAHAAAAGASSAPAERSAPAPTLSDVRSAIAQAAERKGMR